MSETRRAVSSRLDTRAVRVALEDVLREPIAVWDPVATEAPLPNGLGVAFETPTGRAVLAVEPALAAAVVARVLGRSPVLADPLRDLAPDGATAGAFAALVVHALRKSPVEAIRLLRCGAPAALLPPLGVEAATTSFRLSLGTDVYAITLSVDRAGLALTPRPLWNREKLRALGDLPLSVPVLATATLALRSDVANLRVGDAWLPGNWPLIDGNGPIWLAPPRVEWGIAAELVSETELVLVGDRGELRMDETLVDTLGEVPVVVRVEIGAAQLTAKEWAELGRGDVVALGCRVADPVVLRVGGIEVARGELVEIEGEVGVRILSRLEENPNA